MWTLHNISDLMNVSQVLPHLTLYWCLYFSLSVRHWDRCGTWPASWVQSAGEEGDHNIITMSRNIFEAIRAGRLEEVTIRLNLGEDIDQAFPPRWDICVRSPLWAVPRYETPLHTGVTCGREDVVGLLCQRGASLHLTDSEGQTALALAYRWTSPATELHLSHPDFRLNLVSIAELLSSAGAPVTSMTVRSEEQPASPPPWDTPAHNVLDGQPRDRQRKLSAEFLIEKLKIRFSDIFPRRQNIKPAASTEKCDIIPSPKETRNPYYKFKSLTGRFHKIFKRNKSKENKIENKFAKIWLTNPDGRTLKLYTFRKED